jgi:hypothetical protein
MAFVGGITRFRRCVVIPDGQESGRITLGAGEGRLLPWGGSPVGSYPSS